MELKYLSIGILISLLLSMAIVALSRLVVARTLQVDKVQGYECGFQPFSSVLVEFDVQFYVVALPFLLFDVELMLLFPRCVIFLSMPSTSFPIFMVFILVPVIGITYEWRIGGLEFSN
jgi:NADH-quinone oxidoreductase subunit A